MDKIKVKRTVNFTAATIIFTVLILIMFGLIAAGKYSAPLKGAFFCINGLYMLVFYKLVIYSYFKHNKLNNYTMSMITVFNKTYCNSLDLINRVLFLLSELRTKPFALCKKVPFSVIRELYLGKGFVFTPEYSRTLYFLGREGLKNPDRNLIGSPLIHNLNRSKDINIFTPLKNLTTHTFVFGTTGSGKTRLFDLLISQAIMRNDVVIILDPKGDKDLLANTRKACALFGREKDFLCLDILNPKRSNCAYNLIGSSASPTQIAQNISALMRTSQNSSNDAFISHVHGALVATIISLEILKKEVNLGEIRNNIKVITFQNAIIRFFDDSIEALHHNELKRVYLRIKAGLEFSRALNEVNDATCHDEALSVFYEADFIAEDYYQSIADEEVLKEQESFKKSKVNMKLIQSLKEFYGYLSDNGFIRVNPDLEILFNQALNDEIFFSKVTAGINPVLNTLNQKNLYDLFNAPDGRRAFDIYTGGKVIYFSLNTLSDPTLGSYVGKLILSDLCAFAGSLYASDTKDNNHNTYGGYHGKSDHLSDPVCRNDDSAYDKIKYKFTPSSENSSEFPVGCSYSPKGSSKVKSYGRGAATDKDKGKEQSSLKSMTAAEENIYGRDELKRVAIFVDEASEIANEPLVQLLNKSRGVNFALTIATQTIADLSKRLGSTEATGQIIGNCNNIISLRVEDEDTAQSFTSLLPKTAVPQYAQSLTRRGSSNKFSLSDESLSYSRSETQMSLFPYWALMALPNFEYVAKLADGRIIKGVIPLLKEKNIA